MIRVAIVDDHPVARQGVEHIVATVPEVRVVASTASVEELQAALGGQGEGGDLGDLVDVVVLDLYLDGEEPALAAVAPSGAAGTPDGAVVTPGGEVVRAERVILLAVVFARLAGLAQIGVALAVAWPRYPRPAAVLAVAACVWAESLLLLAASWRARTVKPAWATADTAFTIAALVLGAWLTEPRDYGSWANFMYPYSLVAVVAVGAALRRLPAVLAAMAALTAAYVLSAVVIHGDPAWNTAANATAYTANAGISWVVARELRRLGRGLDRSRVEEVAHATELGRERERARHARMLHDHVLQTLETLARDHWVADLDMRLHVAEDAAWLRRLVEGDELDGSPRPGDLLAALEAVAARQERLGLSIELNGAQLRTDPRLRGGIEPRVAAALAEATCEALANVAKHSGVGRAVVQAASDHGGVAVSVVDHGGGFDPELVTRGVGLDQSIRARVEQVGGTARIESAPGSGTVVELWAPLAPGHRAAGNGERPERGFDRVPYKGPGAACATPRAVPEGPHHAAPRAAKPDGDGRLPGCRGAPARRKLRTDRR